MSIWKGRFAAALDKEALTFSSSLPVDKRLFEDDIEGSLAHIAMLAKQRIVSGSDAKRIRKALQEIRREMRSGHMKSLEHGSANGRFVAEDVHMAIEARLIRKIGAVGGRLHTARSRNDQVALDERLYLKRTIAHMVNSLRSLQGALVKQSRKHSRTIMPGYTHLQRAQPILLAHHLLAYVSMLERDRERFSDCLTRAARSPLGAGALAGTSFPIDRHQVARSLRLKGIIENSIDAVSDRDALVEFIAACAMTMMHLSRLAEELVLWSSQEWGFAVLNDALTTGSSIMPQKKNPDMAELVRGKTGRVYGDLMALLTTMKGLPLAYNRDMQEDKEPLFDSTDTTQSSLHIMAEMIGSVEFNVERFEVELREDFSAATDYADYLVRKGVPFRAAHAVVGTMVRNCVEKKRSLESLSLKSLQGFSHLFEKDALDLSRPRKSIARKKSAGSTSPREVEKALRRWERALRKTGKARR